MVYFLFLLAVACPAADKIISPTPFAVQRTDWIKIQIAPDEHVVPPESVVYCISYLSPKSSEQAFREIQRVAAGLPYEYLLDCSRLRDMDLYLKALVFRSGAVETLGTEWDFRGLPVVLDRHSKNEGPLCVARARSGKSTLLQSPDTTVFNSQNNGIVFAAVYDQDSLYLDIKADDNYLNSQEPKTSSLGRVEAYFSSLWQSDGVEICFSMDNHRGEWKTLKDFELLLNIGGEKQGNTWDMRKKEFLHWGGNVRFASTIRGTINRNDDADTGYLFSIAIPWSDLGHAPQPGDSIGFDLQVFDRDLANGAVFRSFWSGCDLSNNDNPSEWGTMLFAPSRYSKVVWFIIVLSISMLILGGWYVQHRGKAVLYDPQKKESQLSPEIKKAVDYIGANYKNELNVQEIADASGLSRSYFSTLFKNETGVVVGYYINQVRINEACRLLTQTQESVTQVGYLVGFSDQSHFTKIFKKLKGVTPLVFRKNSILD